MHNEAVKIILRRFRDRSLESALLIIAVALGIGAFSAGLSLILNTAAYSNEILQSRSYSELIVSTRSEADEMENPVSEKPTQETAVLTMADLSAAELAPDIEWAYVQNRNRLHLISADSTNNSPPEGMEPPKSADRESSGQQSDQRDPRQLSDEDVAAAKADTSIIMSDLDEISGYSVTPQFFNSRNITADLGSLFSGSDLTGTDNLIVIGSELAVLLADNNMETAELLGKKLLTREGYQTIIGILNPVSDNFDVEFFSPYKDQSKGFTNLRRGALDTQLRFAVNDPAKLDLTEALLSEWFSNQFGDSQVLISNPRAEAEQLINRNTGIGLLIMFLSAAGFFIALVNVSNILMSRVIRMKKSVGILMALGSSKKGIIKLFLIEALILAAAGGIAGALFALPLSNYMQSATNTGNGSWLYILFGAVLSGVLTTLFGLIPSRQYMKIDPAQAMRSVS